MIQQFSNKTVREIALASPLTTRVFEEFKIDYCCGGRIALDEACRKAGADLGMVSQRLEAVFSEPAPVDTRELANAPAELIDHIVTHHHKFTRDEIARLLPLTEKVATRHGESHPELYEVQRIFATLAEELLQHMRKEEAVLFPYIEQLERAASRSSAAPMAHFGTVNNPVRMMMFEHDAAGEMLRDIRRLSADFTTPEGACPSYIGLYAGLEDLEKDLHRHIHLENNILFPKAVEMEAELWADAPAAEAVHNCCGGH